MKIRGERLIKLGDSWVSAKVIKVMCCIKYFGVEHLGERRDTKVEGLFFKTANTIYDSVASTHRA